MELKKLKISTKSVVIVFGFACFALIVTGWFYWFQWKPAEVRKLCRSKVIESLKPSDGGIRHVRPDSFNNAYRICLVEHGMKPESIFMEKSDNQTFQKQPSNKTPAYVEQVPLNIENEIETSRKIEVEEESWVEKFNRKQQQECQEKINDYNICMNEYNAKMAEYNECIAKAADPNSLESQGYGRYATMLCTKPSNFCFKPSCSY